MKAIHTAQHPEQKSSTADSPPKDVPASQKRLSKGNAAADTKKGPSSASAYNGSVSAIGDSVMLGAVPRLQKDIKGLGVVDAEAGLQVYDAIRILQSRRATSQLGSLVIVHLGNNGAFTKQEFDQIMHVLSGVDKVVFVNVKVPAPGRR